MATWEFAEKPSLREHRRAAQSRCEATGSAAVPCSSTSRLRSGFQPAIRCGGSESWRIRPSRSTATSAAEIAALLHRRHQPLGLIAWGLESGLLRPRDLVYQLR